MTGTLVADDGCSPTCQIEPGASCTGMPSVCKASICGNGMKEGNEGCDCGTSLTGPWPTGCNGPNGLFFGDASGCSKTCTQGADLPHRCDDAGVRHQLRQRRRRDGRGLRRRQPGRRRRLLEDLHAGGRLHVQPGGAARHGALHAARQHRRVPVSCRSSTATSRTRASAAVTRTSSTWAPRSRTRSASPAFRARPARRPSTSATAFRTRAVRRRRTTRPTAAGTSRRRPWARTASRSST